MKYFFALALLAGLAGCGANNTTFNQPFVPEKTTANRSVEHDLELGLTITDVVTVKDADQILVDVAGLPEVFGNALPVTLNGGWYPQIRDAKCTEETVLATKAARQVESWLKHADRLELINIRRSHEFGVMAEVRLNGADTLTERMMVNGYARPMTESGRWCP